MATVSVMSFGAESTDEVEEIVYTIFIANADDLMELSGSVVKENIMFEADIDMKGLVFKGIASFEGVINGNGKTITGLTIDNSSGGDAGLILIMTCGEIKNLTIGSDSAITGLGNAGAFVAKSSGNVTLQGLTNKANVESTGFGDYAGGGIVGWAIGDTTIDFAYNYKDNAGMVGNGDVTITSSYTLNPNDDNIGVGLEYLSASEFKNEDSFVGWDFDKIWKMGTEHPVLRKNFF